VTLAVPLAVSWFYLAYRTPEPGRSLLETAASAANNIGNMATTKGVSRHVVVVGGGLAGLSASLEALDRGARVTILEKEASVGGNSQRATSGINGAGTKFQSAKNIQDVPEFFR